MKKLIEIEIAFDNQEFIRIPPEEINKLILDECVREVRKINKVIRDKWVAYSVVLNINLSWLQKPGNGLYENVSALERLMYANDITSISLYYADNTSESFIIPWSDADTNENEWQHIDIRDNTIQIIIDELYGDDDSEEGI